jgi:signal transduction histidine kinase/DNA-binding NarL/FixJ family response regulator
MKTKKRHILKQPEYYVLLLAFLVVSAIFTISIITNRTISFLQHSNRNTSNSFVLKDKVQALLADVLLMETTQRGIVLSTGMDAPSSDEHLMEQVENDLKELHGLVNEEFTKEYDQLYFFVRRKLKFTKLIFTTYDKKGKAEAEGIINTQIGDQLRDSIYAYAKQLEHSFGKNVQANLDANYLKSTRLQPTTTVLSVISLVAIIALSWLILYRINQKNQLIRSLRKAHRREIKTRHELEAAKKDAESSAIIKENFLANMSHEIRTPINAVLGFSNILQRTELSKEQSKFVHLIQTSGSSLLSIVNDILDISKIEAGMVKIEKINFSLRSICDSVVTMFASQAKEKKLSLGLQINDNCADTLVGDPLRITQILTNLIGNALKFTSTGGVQLHVSVLETAVDKCLLRFSVEDTGIGMEEQKLSKVFDRFDQGDNETTRKFGGTGLGLTIVKNLVDLQGGKIYVTSRPGEGSKFIFELPLAIQAEQEKPLKTEAALSVEFEKQVRVLVVEDNEVNQMLVDYILKEWGLSFEIASNGKEAVEKLSDQSFDLVLMDIQMPVMDGYTAATFIKKTLKLDVPIIAMTAHALPGEQEKCKMHGMEGYISKPLHEEDLKKELHKYLKQKFTLDTADNSTIIDTEFVHRKFSGNTEFIKKIISKVAEQYPEELKTLEDAIEQKEMETIAMTAHKMRSTVAIVRKESSQSKWLSDIELLATSSPVNWNEINTLFQKLTESEKQLQAEVSQLMITMKIAV